MLNVVIVLLCSANVDTTFRLAHIVDAQARVTAIGTAQ